jgi:hypothetical protein
MKITRDRALEVTAWCRKHRINYTHEGTYPATRRAAERIGITAPNGMILHFPRDANYNGKVWRNTRAYVLWKGEPLSDIEEACAFIVMTQKIRTDIHVLRCAKASREAEMVERNDGQIEVTYVKDQIDSRE